MLVLVVVLVLEVADISPLDQRNKIVAGNQALLEARKSTESRTRTTTRTRTIAKFRDLVHPYFDTPDALAACTSAAVKRSTFLSATNKLIASFNSC